MLGKLVHEPEGVEGQNGTVPALGLLDVETTLVPEKTLIRVEATHVPSGSPLSGYEIHLGKTTGPDCARPFALIGSQPDGAMSPDGRIMGTYIHGCFGSDQFRHAFLKGLGATSDLAYDRMVEESLEALA